MLVLVAASEPAFGQLRLTVIASGLSQPVAVIQDPTDSGVQFIVLRAGTILPVVHGVLVMTPLLDITPLVSMNGEGGLLGLAFPPDAAASRRFFIHFTDLMDRTVIARFERSAANPLVADPASRFDLIWPRANPFIVTPFTNHRGGTLRFGPDGYLYVGLGDGGAGNDPFANAQNLQTLLGKMLRIDVGVPDTDPRGYRIPADNPFARPSVIPALEELWAVGLRNPWKFSFDDPRLGGTGALLIGDVGQSAREEIDYQPPGLGALNYGWRNFEGNLPGGAGPNPPPAYEPLTFPIYDYDRNIGGTVVGGYVYRGKVLGTEFAGRYVFADFASGRLMSLGLGTSGAQEIAVDWIDHTAALDSAVGMPVAIDVDANGELLIVDFNGRLLRLDRTDAAAPVVVRQPADQSVLAGEIATFTAEVSGIPVPAAIWQESINGGLSWIDILGQTALSLRIPAEAGDSGKLLRAVFSNMSGSATTAPATLTVGQPTLRSPGAPSGLEGRASGSTIALTWRPPFGSAAPTNYIVEEGTARGLADIASVPTAGPAPQFTTSGLAVGTYFLRVRAVNTAGTSGPSNEIVLSVRPLPAVPPGAPFGFRASTSGSIVNLQWSPPVDGGLPTSYVITFGSTAGATNLGNLETQGAVTSISVSAFAPVFFARIRAVNGAGTGPESRDIRIQTVQCAGPPSAPTGLMIDAGSPDTVSLVWTPTGDRTRAATSYLVEAGSAPGLSDLLAQDLGGTTPSYHSSAFAPRTYFFRVRATNACGISPPSNEVVVIVP